MLKIKFEPRDLWVGIYWTIEEDFILQRFLKIYICIIPMLPICLDFKLDNQGRE